MTIEVLYVADCPGHPAALRLVRDALAAEGITARIDEVLVADERAARKLRFCGSPTIRLNGKDVDADSGGQKVYGLNCRWYFGSNQNGVPSVEMIRRALLQARLREES